MTASRRNDIIELLLQNGFKKEEKDENINWELYKSTFRRERVCLLKKIDGTECTFHTPRLDRAEMHLRQHKKNNEKENLGTITVLMSKMELQEEKNKVFSKRK